MKPVTVNITGCDLTNCFFVRGSDILLEIEFTSNESVRMAYFYIMLLVLGLEVHFPGYDGAEACRYLFDEENEPVGCILNENKKYTFRITINYDNEYPILLTPLQVKVIIGTPASYIFCFTFETKLQKFAD